MIRAYCYPSGLIEFGARIPPGTLVIARGPEQELRSFISGQARHGYKTRLERGGRVKIPGTEQLLVPGVPEAPNQHVALSKLGEWLKWIAANAPRNVRVLAR